MNKILAHYAERRATYHSHCYRLKSWRGTIILQIMKVHVVTSLPCSPEYVWSQVLTSRLLQYVCWPLATFEPITPPAFPAEWSEGKYRVRTRVLGVPFGTQWIVITKPEPEESGTYVARDNGYSDIIRRWDHWIRIRSDGANGTIYSDTIDIEAGILTPVIWLYASVFYRWRQYRWRRLIRRDF